MGPPGMPPPMGMPPPGMGPPPMGDPAMMGMPPPEMGPPPGTPGFPPGVTPDPYYPGSPLLDDAELMLQLQDPEVAQAVVRMLLEELDPDPGPKYPVWYRKEDYPKPKVGTITTKAEDDRSAFQMLIDRMRRDRDRIRMAVVGSFDNAEDMRESESATFQDASLALDVQLITSILAACDLIFHKTAKKSGQSDDAQKIENVCYALFEQTQRRHHAMHGTNYKIDAIKTGMNTGHLVTRVLPNYDADDGDIPVRVDLLDPATCFPSRDQYGVETMTRTYYQPVKEVCHGFGLDPKKRKSLLGKKHTGKNGVVRDRLMSDVVEVIEYWDRRWYALVVDSDMVIAPTEHLLGTVPFVYSRSAIGDPSNVYEQNLKASYGISDFSRQRDLASKGQSHIQLLQKTHEQREAIMGIVATEIKKIRNPPRTFEQEVTVYGDAPAVTNMEGGIGMLRSGEERETPTPPDARFQLMGPLLANVNEAAQMGRMSPADYGLAPGSQSSGAVVEGLSESSKDKLNLWKVMIQDHEAHVGEMALTFLRDHGRKLGPEGNRGTVMTVEKQHPTEQEDGFFDFDHRLLRDDTCRVRVQMTSLRMQNLGALGNAVQMWSNMGRMSDEEALTLRGVRDPEAYMRKVNIENFKKTPEYQTAKLLEWMKQEDESPETMGTVMYLLATKGGGGGGPPPGGPGPMPGNGGGPPTVGMPGGPGQDGGRPMGGQIPGPAPSMQGLP